MRKHILFILVLTTAISFAQNSAVRQFNKTFADVAEESNPSVVTIMTEKVYDAKSFHEWTPFEEYFFPKNKPHRQYKGHALGSGVIVDEENGYILTNNHVIDDADEIEVKLMDKRVFSAKIIGKDPKSDLAVLQIEATDLSELKLGNSDKIRVGEWVLAVGSPFSANLSHTVTAGIVSALGRSNVISNDHYENFIQTDAAINPGNSGGPLLNINGSLIGINTAIYQEAEGIGFAIPIDNARRIVNELIRFGKVRRGWIGISDKYWLVALIPDQKAEFKAGFRHSYHAGCLPRMAQR